jgi:DNA-directed RNA polymerase beta' subunit
MNNFTSTREAIERIKDIESVNIKGSVKDWHIADVLKIPYSSFRNSIMKDRLPLKQIVLYCKNKNINVNKIIF